LRVSLSTFFLTLLVFLASLALTMSAAAWFTRRLEALCDRLDLAPGILSILSALGANIPNYLASIVAIANAQLEVGLGIILGSNIYNIAIILGLATFATGHRSGIELQRKEIRDVRVIGLYACSILLSTLILIWLLPGTRFVRQSNISILFSIVLLSLACLTLFISLVVHIARRVHPAHMQGEQVDRSGEMEDGISLVRLIVEIVLALGIAMGGVAVMVQAGERVTVDVNLSPVLAGLVVLAVATSLPNTVVAIILARTGRATACVEEIWSSNSINAALGIALPLVIWHAALHDDLLSFLDAPLMLLLTLVALLFVMTGRLGRYTGACFVVSYALWIGVHLFVGR
jgi:cation:H+ antiporter